MSDGFDVLLRCDPPTLDVRVQIVDSTRQIDPDVERRIDATWRESERRGVHLFDGGMCRFEGYEHDGGRLVLRVSRTSYRVFLGTNLLGDRAWPADVLANPIGVSTALRLPDGRLAFGVRNDRVAYYPGRLHPFSGSMDWADRIDVFAEALRELAEELSLAADDVEQLDLLGIAADRDIRHPELILHATVRPTLTELAGRLDPAEHADLVPVGDALPHQPVPTPVACATFTLVRHFTGE